MAFVGHPVDGIRRMDHSRHMVHPPGLILRDLHLRNMSTDQRRLQWHRRHRHIRLELRETLVYFGIARTVGNLPRS